MSKIEELIQQYCPDGVEWKPIEEISIPLKGMGGVSNKWADSGNCQFIDYKNAYNHIKIDVTLLPYATIKNPEKQTVLQKGDILFTSASETPDECAISSVIEDEIQEGIFLDDHLFGIRLTDKYKSLISVGFLKHFFRTSDFRKSILIAVRGVTRHYISKPDFMKLSIPIPPLEVQEEIVRILDKFSLLTAELEAELELRRKQYDFYRNQLLSFDSDSDTVQWKTLGEVCEFRNGFAFKSNLFRNNGLPIIRITNIFGNTIRMEDIKFFDEKDYASVDLTPFEIKKGDILIAMSGATTGKIGIYKQNYPAYLNQRIGKFIPKKELNNQFLYYYLSTKVNFIYNMAGGGAQPNLSSNELKEKLIIPIPPLSEQQRIVDILDRFDALVNDLSAGLPAEIEARRKQYEYYRDTLLTFKRKAE